MGAQQLGVFPETLCPLMTLIMSCYFCCGIITILHMLTWCKCLEKSQLSNNTCVGKELYFTSSQPLLVFNYMYIVIAVVSTSIFLSRASLLLYSSYLIEMRHTWQMFGELDNRSWETTGAIYYTREMKEKGNKISTTLSQLLTAASYISLGGPMKRWRELLFISGDMFIFIYTSCLAI